MKRVLALVATFAVTLAVVLGAAALAPVVTGDTQQSLPDIDMSHYTDDDLLTDGTPGSAEVSMGSDEEPNTVLVDAGPFVQERDVRPLVNALTEGGHDVRVRSADGPVRPPVRVGPVPVPGGAGRGVSSSGPSDTEEESLEERLADVDAYVSVGAGGYSDEEVETLTNFTESGGRVLLTADPDNEYDSDFGNAVLQSGLGVGVEPGYVYNIGENDLNYLRVFGEASGTDALTEGVDRAVFPSVTPVTASDGSALVRAIDDSQLSTTRDDTDAGLLARDGGVTIVGDSQFMTPENVQRVDNDVLVGNVADFLVTGERKPMEPEDAENESDTDDGEGGVETVRVGPGGEPRFEPQSVRIEPGTTVKFVWESDGHNLVVRDQPEDGNWTGVPEVQEEGFTHNHTFEVEGVYEFASEPSDDEGMVGGILVGDPPGPDR